MTTKAVQKARDAAFEKQKGLCYLCGLPMNKSKNQSDPNRVTADHIVPQSQGGKNKNNICAAHSRCNYERDKTPIPLFLFRWNARSIGLKPIIKRKMR